MSEPVDIAAAAIKLAVKRPQLLAGKTAIVTAGPTIEPIDPGDLLPIIHQANKAMRLPLHWRHGRVMTLISGQ